MEGTVVQDRLLVPDGVVDGRTRLIAIGMASNVTGTIHEDALRALQAQVDGVFAGGSGSNGNVKPLTVLDCTHYAPHRKVDLTVSSSTKGDTSNSPLS